MRLIVFDFDGTLADTNKGIIATEQETLLRLGLPPGDPEKMKLGIGLPLRESLSLGLGIPDDDGHARPDRASRALSGAELLDRAEETYRTVFDEIAMQHISLFPGVVVFLESCRAQGILCTIATSRSERTLRMILEEHGISDYFCLLLTVNDHLAHKPDPAMVLETMARLGVPPSETLVVGDTTFDLEMGRRAGARTCGVTYGNHPRSMLLSASPDLLVDNLLDIPLD